MQLHKKEPSKGYDALALNISEKSRARGLIELLTESHAKIRKGASPELLAEERRLQLLIDSKEKLRFELVNSDQAKNPNSQATVEKLKTIADEGILPANVAEWQVTKCGFACRTIENVATKRMA